MKPETIIRILGQAKKEAEANKFNNFRLRGDNFTVNYQAFNGSTMTLPPDLLPAEKVAEIAALLLKKREDFCAKLKADRLETEKRLDEAGFSLLAGEETDVVFRGTWRQCRENLWRLNSRHGKKIPRYDNGIGCWLIVKEDFEAESGKFDKDMYW